MKKLLFIAISLFIGAALTTSCDDDDTWNDYREWREANNEWYLEQLNRTNDDGTPYYTNLKPAWNPESGVLIHYFNDRSQTAGNLSPILTSNITVRYVGRLYNDVGFDSTSVETDGVRTFQLAGTVLGWKVALSDMHVGDTCEVIIPYTEGYGIQGSSGISPYSVLKFNIRLVDIPGYERQ